MSACPTDEAVAEAAALTRVRTADTKDITKALCTHAYHKIYHALTTAAAPSVAVAVDVATASVLADAAGNMRPDTRCAWMSGK